MSDDKIYSNAFNFSSFITTGVDPRTGQYSATIKLTTLRPHNIANFERDLSLSFAPLAFGNQGFGNGWRLALTALDLERLTFTKADGKSFKANTIPPSGYDLSFKDQKLLDFKVHKEDSQNYIVYNKDGTIERLFKSSSSSIAKLASLEFPNGEAFEFTYQHVVNGETYLTSIRHRQTGTQHLTLNYDGTVCPSFEYPEDNGVTARVLLNYANEMLTSVTVPFDKDEQTPSPPDYPDFTINYDTTSSQFPVITRFKNPAGSIELVSYLYEGIKLTDTASLPCAAVHEIHPGFNQPAMKKTYEYSLYNFTGYASGKVDYENDQDNLYLVVGDYNYTSKERILNTAGETVSITERTFNKFHLMTSEVKTQDNKVTATEITYNEDPQKSFSEQPANLQLPSIVLTRYTDALTSEYREETVETQTDDYGNTLSSKDITGVKKVYTYYAKEGETGLCPADPLGFVRFMKSITQQAAPDSRSTPDKVTRYQYDSLPTLASASLGSYVVKATETMDAVSKSFTYVDDNTNNTHGLLSSIVSTMNGKEQIASFTHVYDTSRIKTSVTITGFDGTSMQSDSEVSIYSQRQLKYTDVNGVLTEETYDLLGRITSQMILPGPDAPPEQTAVERTYTYDYPDGSASDSWPVLTETDSIKVNRKTYYDGTGRICAIDEQDDDGTYDTDSNYQGTYRRVLAKNYDHFGQEVEEITTDWFWDLANLVDGEQPVRSAAPQTSTKTYEYDGWGNRCRTTHSDGRIELSIYDPVTLTMTEGLEGLGTTETVQNLFEQPDVITMRQADNTEYASLNFEYDGFGRLISQSDAAGHTTTSTYDTFDRVIQKILPDKTQIDIEQADFSNEALPSAVKVNSDTLGTIVYDGLGRAASDTIGGRTIEYQYTLGSDKPSIMTLPNATVQNLTYIAQLGGVLSQVTTNTDTQEYSYDTTGVLLSATDTSSNSQFDYFPSGILKHESLSGTGGNSAQTAEGHYLYSMSGQIQRHTDSFGQHHDYTYDNNGKVVQTTQGQQRAVFEYDTFGRLTNTVTCDDATSHELATVLTYDDFGRELTRTIINRNNSGQISEQTLSHSYTVDNQIASKTNTLDGAVLSDEQYQYDNCQRLSIYTCDGSNRPVDESGRALSRQTYQYDQWGNISQLDNQYGDGDSAVTETLTYGFGETDPTQLVSITNGAQSITLEYDANGNLTRDEKGQTLIYDANNRLSQVNDPDGNLLCTYQYDAMNKLISQTLANGTVNRQFFAAGRVTNAQYGEDEITYLSNNEYRVGEQCISGDDEPVYSQYASDSKHTPFARYQQGQNDQFSYTPYGFRNPLGHLPGLANAMVDPVTGWYFLGNGYRVYNPVLMRFHSPDSWSPFGNGGINPYVYCLSDPINRLDPNGHLSGQAIASIVLGSIGILIGILTLGAGAAVSAGLIAGSGVVGAVATTSAIGVTATVIGIAADATAIASAALEEKDPQAASVLNWVSRGLGILSAVGGIADLATSSVRGVSQARQAATDAGQSLSRTAAFRQTFTRSMGLSAVAEGSNLMSNVTGVAAAGISAADGNAEAANVLGWVSIGFGAASLGAGISEMAGSAYASKHSGSWDVDHNATSTSRSNDEEGAVTLIRVRKLEEDALAINPPNRATEVNRAVRGGSLSVFNDSAVDTRKLLRRRMTI